MTPVTTSIIIQRARVGKGLFLLPHQLMAATVLPLLHHLQHHALKVLDTLLPKETHTLLSKTTHILLSHHPMAATPLTLPLHHPMAVEAITAAHFHKPNNHLMAVITLLLLNSNSNRDKVLLLALLRKLLPMAVVPLIHLLLSIKHLMEAIAPMALLHLKHLPMAAHLINNNRDNSINSILNKAVIPVNKCLLPYLNPSQVACPQAWR